jgi:uncharacterized protein
MAKKVKLLQWLGGKPGLTAAVVALALTAMGAPVLAQFRSFDNFFSPFPRLGPSERPVDYSRAPPPHKYETQPPGDSVLVLGDSMADWLAYGLEDALGDPPDLAVIRRNRALSGLIHYDARNEAQDWPAIAREAIAQTKPKFIVMMVGLNDRQPLRERVQPEQTKPPAGAAPPQQQTQQAPAAAPSSQPKTQTPDAADAESTPATPAPVAPPAVATAEPAKGAAVIHTYEFRSDEWALAYSRRIDATIAALKSGGVPVFWVGLPSVRGPKSTSDMQYLDDLIRTRAERAGITYIDVWDGFVDENGRYVAQGPDFEGQTRRLRTSDGVHFTRPGARKLAHYVEREIRRIMTPGSEPIALPQSEPQVAMPARPSGPAARPMSGPVIPLTASIQGGQELIGAGDPAAASVPRSVTRVLVKGEPIAPPAGRADDFAWPRRGIAPVGADPVVATTTDPIPVMKPAPETTVAAPSAETRAVAAAPAPKRTVAVRPPPPPPPQQRSPGFSFFNFGSFGR